MSQVTDFVTPGTPLTMAGLKTFIDACFAAAVDGNRGSSAPSNPIEGMLWWDTSGGATAEVLKRYTVAGGWVSIMTFNVTAGTIVGLSALLDEDDMASDSAVLPPSQQSVKAYVDNKANVDGNRGSSAPSNPIEGMLWWDTSGGATAEVLKRYTVAGGWVSLLTFNITAGTITRIWGILDEDDMASNSALLPPSQQSVKAYVDPVYQYKVPVGAMMDWPTETPPTGWLERNGASLLRADYAALFAVIGTMYGAADGTHFNLPDDRGRFGRWWAHGQTTDPDRATRTAPTAPGATLSAGDHVGTEQEDAFQGHYHNLLGNNVSGSYLGAVSGRGNVNNTGVGGLSILAPKTDGTNGTPRTSTETRPINRAYMPIIKYSLMFMFYTGLMSSCLKFMS